MNLPEKNTTTENMTDEEYQEWCTELALINTPLEMAQGLYALSLRAVMETHRAQAAESTVLDLAGAILDFLAGNGMDGPVFPEPPSPNARFEGDSGPDKCKRCGCGALVADLHFCDDCRALFESLSKDGSNG